MKECGRFFILLDCCHFGNGPPLFYIFEIQLKQGQQQQQQQQQQQEFHYTLFFISTVSLRFGQKLSTTPSFTSPVR